MNSERNILSRLLEGKIEIEPEQPLDEKTYTVGDTQYWKRSGKYYSWTEAGGRKEIGEDDYMKAISGGSGSSPKHTEPEHDAAKKDPEPEKPIEVQGHSITYNPETKYWDVKDASGKVKMEAMSKEDAIGFAKREPKSEPSKKRDAYGDRLAGKMKSEEEVTKGMSPQNLKAYEQVEDAITMLSPRDVGKKEYDKVQQAYSNFANTGDLTQLDYVARVINKVTGGNIKVELPPKSDASEDEILSYKDRWEDEILQASYRSSAAKVTAMNKALSNAPTGTELHNGANFYKATGDRKFKKVSEDGSVDDTTYTVHDVLKELLDTDKQGTLTIMDPRSSGKKSEPKPEPSPIEKRRNAFYDDSESDYVSYDGVRDFDHTSWVVSGQEATIQRNPSGRGYYLQTEDFDEEFDTKGDLVHFLHSEGAEYIGQDSEHDY